METNMGVVATPPGTCATNATHVLSIDRTGYDYATFVVNPGTFATDGETFRTITLKESDTSTVHTSQTTVTGANFAATTSTSATSSMPAVTELGLGSLVILGVDLRKRKKYVSVGVTPGTTTSNITIIAALQRPGQSKDSAAQKYELNYAATSNTSIAGISTF